MWLILASINVFSLIVTSVFNPEDTLGLGMSFFSFIFCGIMAIIEERNFNKNG